MNPQQPSDIQARLLARATTDPTFRQQLLTNARAAIEQELGIKLRADLEIQVMEETPTKLCLVLPMKQQAKGELADAAVAGIVGGTDLVANLPGPLPMPVADIPGPMPTPVYSYERLLTFRRY